MYSRYAIIPAFAALALASPVPEAVSATISPSTPAPSGCSTSYSGTFEITVVNVTSSAKRDLSKRVALTISLQDGVLTDADGRTGYIAANDQFQFDDPPQAGAIYTAGFSVCGNGSLALGGSAIWYQCLSGSFYNLYDKYISDLCNPIYIYSMGGSGSSVTQASDGQPAATSGAVSQISDGQPQATTGVPVSQISDGQPQATTGVPVTQISDGQIQATTGVPVTQISDGQIQATTGTSGAPVTQISDGQIQATTGTSGAPVTQISDGQIQATTGTSGAPVTQISDGQIQATTGAPVTQISDGQIQATTGTTGAPVTQISDGQIQATTGSVTVAAYSGATTTAAVATYTGAADRLGGSLAVVAGIAGAIILL